MFSKIISIMLFLTISLALATFGYGVGPEWKEHDPSVLSVHENIQESKLENGLRGAENYEAYLSELETSVENEAGDVINSQADILMESRVESSETQAVDCTKEITALKAIMEEQKREYDVQKLQIRSMMQQIDALVRQSGKALKILGVKDAGAKVGTYSTAEDANSSLLSTGGVHFIRWGRNTCPNSTVELYRGYTAGTHHTSTYGEVNTLCLHDNPQWGTYNDAAGVVNYIHGAEYRFTDMPFSTKNNGGSSLFSHDVPCIACHSPLRTTQIMIPARRECPTGWTLEYTGYLVSNVGGSYARSDYICLDEEPEVKLAGQEEKFGLLFYPIRAACGSLACPKYVQGRQIACVVCSK